MIVSFAHAFSDPDNRVGDVVRCVVIALGTIQMGMYIALARRVRNTRQYGLLACVCLGVSAIGTEIEHLGDVVTYRLLFNTAGVVLGVIFLWKTSHQSEDESDKASLH